MSEHIVIYDDMGFAVGMFDWDETPDVIDDVSGSEDDE